jgi:hypothetical protein
VRRLKYIVSLPRLGVRWIILAKIGRACRTHY